MLGCSSYRPSLQSSIESVVVSLFWWMYWKGIPISLYDRENPEDYLSCSFNGQFGVTTNNRVPWNENPFFDTLFEEKYIYFFNFCFPNSWFLVTIRIENRSPAKRHAYVYVTYCRHSPWIPAVTHLTSTRQYFTQRVYRYSKIGLNTNDMQCHSRPMQRHRISGTVTLFVESQQFLLQYIISNPNCYSITATNP